MPLPLPPPPVMTPLPELSMATAEETATRPPVARVANAASDAIPLLSQPGFSLGGVGLLCSLYFSISLLNRTILIKQRRAPAEPNRRRTTCLPRSGQSHHEHQLRHVALPTPSERQALTRQHESMREDMKKPHLNEMGLGGEEMTKISCQEWSTQPENNQDHRHR